MIRSKRVSGSGTQRNVRYCESNSTRIEGRPIASSSALASDAKWNEPSCHA